MNPSSPNKQTHVSPRNTFSGAPWSTLCQCFQQERTWTRRTSLTTPFQTGPSDLCLWGLNLWTEALYTHTHTRSHTMPQHLFLSCEYKTTLTGALSALVESSRWNVYLYIQMAGCHVVSHNVSWTNNVSHFSIRPAALKPPSSLYSHSNTQAPWPQKGKLVSPQWSATLN